MEGMEIVLIGDVIKSRKKFDPENWDYFHQLIKKVNEDFKNSIKIPFTIYSGDSFGGVCRSIEDALEIILRIQENQQYHKSRFVLIEDVVSFGMDKKVFVNLEGPALWKSQKLFEELKKKPSFFISDLQDGLKTKTINTILNLILAIRNDWNDLEWKVYRYNKLELKQIELADKLNVSQQYVSKIIRSSRMKLILESENSLKQILHGLSN